MIHAMFFPAHEIAPAVRSITHREGFQTVSLSILAALVLTGTARAGQDPTILPDHSRQQLVLPVKGVPAFEVEAWIDGAPRTLHMWAHSVRQEGAVVLAHGEDGALAPVDLPAPTTYRGTVLGWPRSRVAGSLRGSGLSALIVGAAGERIWAIEPDPERPGKHLVYQQDDLPPGGGRCGSIGASAPAGPPPITGPVEGPRAIQVCELAYDADNAYFQQSGGTTAGTIADIEQDVNAVGVIYEYQLGVNYEISGGIIRDDPATDPYADVYTACNTLGAVKAVWNQDHADIARDLTHMWSGKISGPYIGCAFGNTVCATDLAFAVSTRIGSYVIQAAIVSHELGHVWGACHCDQVNCTQYDPSGCGIMKSSPGGSTLFGASTVAGLKARIAQATCLSVGEPSSPPSLSLLSPPQVQALDGGDVMLFGDLLYQALYVQVGEASIHISDYVVTPPDLIEFAAPAATQLGPIEVSVSGTGGTSNTLAFEYVEVSPPKVLHEYFAAQLWPGANTWNFAGAIGQTAELLLSLDDTTVIVDGMELLANAAVVETAVLTDPGIGSYTREISWDAWGLDFWMQVAVYDSAGALVEVSDLLFNHVGF